MVLEKRLVAGLLAGLATGALNYAAIVFTVRSLIKPGTGKSGTAVALLVYFAKLGLIGGFLALLVIYMKHFSIKGFLIGFTSTLLVIAVEAVRSTMQKQVKQDGI